MPLPDSLQTMFDRYDARIAEIAETRRGDPRPEILQDLVEATAELSGCIPIRQLEVLARRISDGESIDDEPAEDDYLQA